MSFKNLFMLNFALKESGIKKKKKPVQERKYFHLANKPYTFKTGIHIKVKCIAEFYGYSTIKIFSSLVLVHYLNLKTYFLFDFAASRISFFLKHKCVRSP
jgi:hypothetical protein